MLWSAPPPPQWMLGWKRGAGWYVHPRGWVEKKNQRLEMTSVMKGKKGSAPPSPCVLVAKQNHWFEKYASLMSYWKKFHCCIKTRLIFKMYQKILTVCLVSKRQVLALNQLKNFSRWAIRIYLITCIFFVRVEQGQFQKKIQWENLSKTFQLRPRRNQSVKVLTCLGRQRVFHHNSKKITQINNSAKKVHQCWGSINIFVQKKTRFTQNQTGTPNELSRESVE